MATTDNHEYETPEDGATDWHIPLNTNFEVLDTDVELRDTDADKDQYDPDDGAKFLATDTGNVYLGDGDTWNLVGTFHPVETATQTASGDGNTIDFAFTHDLGTTPTVALTPRTADAVGAYLSVVDDSGYTITYETAPPNGTDNLEWDVTLTV